MSTSRHIDKICIAVVIFSLLLTVLFINGEKLGLKAVQPEGGDEMFSPTDLDCSWDASGASQITLEGSTAGISGSGAFFENGNVNISAAGDYRLTGSLEGGSVIINAGKDDVVRLMLDGVSVKSNGTAALCVEQAGKTVITLADSSQNFFSSGTEAEDESTNGVIFSRDDLTLNGKGTLIVSAQSGHAIVCKDDLLLCGGTVKIDAAEDGIHANDSVRITGTELTVSAGHDGITVSNDDRSDFVFAESGKINIVKCIEGIEAAKVTVAGGDISIAAADDGINADDNSAGLVKIDGGNVEIICENGRDVDGIDSNRDIEINGGRVFISVPSSGSNTALDYGSENGGECRINGGTVIACGSSAMFEGVSESSGQGFIVKTSSCPAGSVIKLEDKNGEVLINETVPCAFSSVILSAPGLETGDACVLTLGESTEETTVDSTPAAENGGFGGGFPGGHRGEKPDNGSDPQNGERPEMPEGDFDPQNGERPEIPQGGFDPQSGERPEMPEGDFDPQNGERPEMPPGGFDPQSGERPEMPPGGFDPQNGERPEMPPGGFDPQSGERPEMPQGGFDPQSGERPEMPQGGFDPGGEREKQKTDA